MNIFLGRYTGNSQVCWLYSLRVAEPLPYMSLEEHIKVARVSMQIF